MPIKREKMYPFEERLICKECGEEMFVRSGDQPSRRQREPHFAHFCKNGHRTDAALIYPRTVFYTQAELDEIERNEQEEHKRRGE